MVREAEVFACLIPSRHERGARILRNLMYGTIRSGVREMRSIESE